MTLSPAQCRAARALLNWSQEDLVRHSKITKKTIADFERGATTPRAQTLAQILAAFEAQGVEFLNGNRPGGCALVTTHRRDNMWPRARKSVGVRHGCLPVKAARHTAGAL